ncbi:hypothetical protein LJC26_07575 [Desulfovibrio sp. OttesenSCG-928-O18]|nr:hypothetical protein [Desulfovibrio sp. OttesenSCG-928-O18]
MKKKPRPMDPSTGNQKYKGMDTFRLAAAGRIRPVSSSNTPRNSRMQAGKLKPGNNESRLRGGCRKKRFGNSLEQFLFRPRLRKESVAASRRPRIMAR